MTRNTKCTQLA